MTHITIKHTTTQQSGTRTPRRLTRTSNNHTATVTVSITPTKRLREITATATPAKPHKISKPSTRIPSTANQVEMILVTVQQIKPKSDVVRSQLVSDNSVAQSQLHTKLPSQTDKELLEQYAVLKQQPKQLLSIVCDRQGNTIKNHQ